MAEYSVLVLPLPVGPVTSTSPQGRRIASSKRFSDSASNPSPVMSSISLLRSSSRSTIFSPCRVGRQETRKSISFAPPFAFNLNLMRPSWGSRFSAMSSFAITFRREVMVSRYFSGGSMTPYREPSIRNRIRYSFSYGSKWTSLAPF